MELTRGMYRFLHTNAIVVLVLFWAFGISLMYSALKPGADTHTTGASMLIGFLLMIAGGVILALHWLLHVGVRDGAIILIEKTVEDSTLSQE